MMLKSINVDSIVKHVGCTLPSRNMVDDFETIAGDW